MHSISISINLNPAEYVLNEVVSSIPITGKYLRQSIVEFYRRNHVDVVDHAVWNARENLLPDPGDLFLLDLKSSVTKLIDGHGNTIAWKGELQTGPGESLVCSRPPICLHYPWELLDWNARLLQDIQPDYDPQQISPLAHVEGRLKLGNDSKLLPGVVIEGEVYIGEHCKIGPNCYIRGQVSIGDHCVIGQSVEIKSSVIGDGTFISHLSYVGDSLIGSNVNLGAGTICSNYRHDGRNHRVMLDGRLHDTGRDKLGAIIGDGARLGCNTVVYPGRIIGPGKTTLPGQIVTRNLDA